MRRSIAAILAAFTLTATATSCAAPQHTARQPTVLTSPNSRVVPAAAAQSNLITTVTHVGDIQVGGPGAPNPQFILTTAPTTFDGSAIDIRLTIEYVNEIPDPTTTSNGIGFMLYEDGKYVMQLALVGAHLANSPPLFSHLDASTVIDGSPGTAAAPTGSHVFAISVYKWSPNGDGYLRGGDAPPGGTPNPIRLTITYL